eukprot:TRINITY_DN1364_c0_g1_i2.p1 TRINITY_DN1364_c0_g1~~TRINITY_DN1364_c0_g1_i2.p1  ORF type:complete len:1245 (+),score=525.43 TRINITY_DN1364_c0_g1_i2:122-3856(+)
MATLKIHIIAARDLPIMDSQSHLTDAYILVKHKDESRKTEVRKRTLNPKWNEVLSFDIADMEDLQEDPLEIKVMDLDRWTADDPIGTVFVDINSLLVAEQPRMEGWMPIFDTMRGLRGELHLIVSIKFMGGKESNPFLPFIPECREGQVEAQERKVVPSIAAETDCVLIFATNALDPAMFRVEKVVGMVEELICRDDPEHARLQSLRNSRTVNESRMLQFFKASGQVRRALARKTSNFGCNCILGFRELCDLETQGGQIIIRAYGTCCQISRIIKEDSMRSPTGSAAEENVVDRPLTLGHAWPATTRRKRHMRNLHQLMKEATKLLTIKGLPANVVKRIGGVVSARSIKLITALKKTTVTQERDSWWQEIREEIKLHARSFSCNAVIGYTETATFHEDICILSASGTAVVADWSAFTWPITRHLRRQHNKITKKGEACQIVHMSVTDLSSKLITSHEDEMARCLWCKQKPVPAFLLANCEIPPDLPHERNPMLIEAHYVKKKEASSGEPLAIEMSKVLPHLEYHIHRHVVHKVQKHGFNAAFGLRVDLAIGEKFIIATATATAVYVPCLPVVEPETVGESLLRTTAKTSLLKLDYFAAPQRLSPSGRDRHPDGELEGSVSQRPGSPHAGHATASSPSDSEEDSSSTTTSSFSSASSDASTFSGSSGGMFAMHHNERVKPYVVDIESTSEDPGMPHHTASDECIYFNIDTLAASPLNLKASHSINIQRRFDFLTPASTRSQANDPNVRLAKIFQYLHSILRMKVAQLGKCVLASYRSEVSFASDDDINVRLIGFVLVPFDNRQWYRSSLSMCLDEMLWRDEYKRSARNDGSIRHLKFVLVACRDPSVERTTIPNIELYWERGSYTLTKLECTVDRPVYLQLPEPVLVSGYRVQTSSEESTKDPISWLVYGLRGTRMKHERATLLSEVVAFDTPTERSVWTSEFDVNTEQGIARKKYIRSSKAKDSGQPHLERTKSKKKLSCPHITVPPPVAECTDARHSPHAQPHLSQTPGSPKKSPKRKILQGLMTKPASEVLDESTLGRFDSNAHESHATTLESPAVVDDEARKKARGRKYLKPDKWELPYLQATSPFCFNVSGRDGRDLLADYTAHPRHSILERTESSTFQSTPQAHALRDPDSHNVTITPMDYIPGAVILRYQGYLSHHFLRETEKARSGTNPYSGLGTFYHYQMVEANHVIRRLVHSMQGNALLSCAVTQHVMRDSDESRSAYHFFTITGQVAHVALEGK